jgi:hypothetical protein
MIMWHVIIHNLLTLSSMKTKMAKGGKRLGAGRKGKYGEATITVNTRVPKSRKKDFKEKVKAILKKWERSNG